MTDHERDLHMDRHDAYTAPEGLIRLYLPVTHSNGARLVQITDEAGRFCGWADGADKYDYPGSWEIDADWNPEQDAAWTHCLQILTEVSTVIVEIRGLARKVISIPF